MNHPKKLDNLLCPHCKESNARITEMGFFIDYKEKISKNPRGNKSGNFFISILCPKCYSFGPIEYKTNFEKWEDALLFLNDGADISKYDFDINPF